MIRTASSGHVFRAQRALVLDGSRGIGSAVARRFVAEGVSAKFTHSGTLDAAQALAA